MVSSVHKVAIVEIEVIDSPVVSITTFLKCFSQQKVLSFYLIHKRAVRKFSQCTPVPMSYSSLVDLQDLEKEKLIIFLVCLLIFMLWNVFVHLWFLKPIFCNIFSHLERRNVTSCYPGCKISVSQQSILVETAICIVEWWKKSMGYPFVPECNRAVDRKSCMSIFFFFLSYFQDHGLLRSRNFVTIAMWHNNCSYPL